MICCTEMASGESPKSQLSLSIPSQVARWLLPLQENAAPTLLVGGVVRDALRGQSNTDWDVATALRPEQLQQLYPQADLRDLAMGALHLHEEGVDLTITTFRSEGQYQDHRRPGEWQFEDDHAVDAQRRDFTVNAIYADPWTLQLHDPVGGLDDLRQNRLCMIGPSETRLREDPLRMLRAVRFAAAHDLTITEDIKQVLHEHHADLQHLSYERVYQELTRSFSGPGRGRALRLLLELGLAQTVLPEILAMPGVQQPPQYHPEGDVFVHTCLVLDHVLPGDPVQAWCAVLHDVGKPATFERAQDRIRFHGHDQLSAHMADEILRRLHAPKALREAVVEISRDHIRFACIPEMTKSKQERWMRSPLFGAHLEFHRADCLGSHAKLDIYELAKTMWQNLPPLPPPPLCSGKDVIALGVTEGPVIGEVLRALQVELDQQGITERDDAMGVLRSLVQRHLSSPS